MEWFFLDWIDAETSASSIGGEHQPIVAVLADKAETAISRLEMTFAGAEIANDAVGLGVEMPPCGLDGTIWQGFPFGSDHIKLLFQQ